jgi:hypothetical protein
MAAPNGVDFAIVTLRSLALSASARSDRELHELFPGPVLLVPIRDRETATLADRETRTGPPDPGPARVEDFHDAVIVRLSPDASSGRKHVTIGRAWDDDVFVGDPSVSRCHGVIAIGPGAIYSDCVSTNGSRVRGKTVEPEHPVDLESGDRIELASACVLFLEPAGLRALVRGR